ncbi:murein biosynthesis integral membrane protein MurJ [Patescibacteria group bacterium]|nr:murein biosynthesis integral membrane protein MurJ [Patescibacteria group bacterium]MBU1889907.1 murein biosynthesis integral membrane protein MurJ [Patescibacteria group bacterium]
MFSKILYKLQTTILGGAIIVGTASVVSRLIGLLRDRLLASSFGAGDTLDVYYAAFRLPDLIFNILVLGALSSSFIPVFLEYWHKDKSNKESKKEAWQVTNSVLNLLVIGLVIIGGLIFVLTPHLMHLVVPGFSPEKQAATASLTRLMLISILFFGISNVVSGVLNSFRRFFAFSLAPIMYNVGIIFGILVLAPRWGVKGLAMGVVIGALVHLLIQLPAVWKAGFRYQWVINTAHKGVRKIGRLMVPRALGLAVVQINQLVINIIASTLRTGSVAIFNLANNLQSFPISVFGISLAISAFPVFSKAFAEKDTKGFVFHFSETFRRILFFVIPVSVTILLLRAQIVRLILGSGNFDWTDTVLTANTLGIFSLSLFAQSLIPMLARSFYAFQNTRTPVIISLISMVINVGLGIIFSLYWGISGLAVAFTIASIVNMLLLLATLRVSIGDLDDQRIIRSTFKVLFASAALGLIIQRLKYFIAPLVDMQTFLGVFLQTSIAFLVGAFVYIVVALILQCEEIDTFRNWLIKAREQLFNGTSEKRNVK